MFLFARFFAASVAVAALVSCVEPEVAVTHGDNLNLLATYELEVQEPSGLSLAEDGASLWINSDEGGMVHRVSLKGEPLERFQVDEKDVEGIAAVGNDRLALIAERGRKLVIYSTGGKRLDGQK